MTYSELFNGRTSECVVAMLLCVQLLCGSDDSCHRVDDEAFLSHTSVCHMAIRA